MSVWDAAALWVAGCGPGHTVTPSCTSWKLGEGVGVWLRHLQPLRLPGGEQVRMPTQHERYATKRRKHASWQPFFEHSADVSTSNSWHRDVLERLTTIRSPPPLDQSDHRGKKRNLQEAKSGRAIFGLQPYGSQTPPPPSSNASLPLHI